MAKIAERAKIAKSVLLYHFTNKDEIVSAVVETVFGAAAAVIIPAVSSVSHPADQLHAYIGAHLAFLTSHRTAAIALYEISTSYRSAGGLRLDQVIAADVDDRGMPAEFALLDPQNIVERGIQAGQFRSEADPLLIKDMLRAALDGAVSNLARDPDYPLQQYISTVQEIFSHALGANP